MSTRSSIAIQYDDESVRCIYCRNDGDLAGVGSTLLVAYQDHDKVEELLTLGDLSSVGLTTDGTVAYGRDRGEAVSRCRAYATMNEYVLHELYDSDFEFAYLYSVGSGWIWANVRGSDWGTPEWSALTDADIV